MKLTYLLAAAAVIFSSCANNNEPGTIDCTDVEATFAEDVLPIITSSCATSSCHASGTSNGPGPLTNYNQVFSAKTSVEDAVTSGRMPKNSSLSAAQRNTIVCWIRSGAINN